MFRLRLRHALPLAFLMSGCSLLVQFNPESQPCDALNECLPGYQCGADKLCKLRDGGTSLTDGGGSCTTREANCADGLDDDCDGQRDCADTDCNAQACNDGNLCTTGDVCSNGTCVAGQPRMCNAPPACQMTAGRCDLQTGNCTYDPLPDGTSCGTSTAFRCCGGACRDLSQEEAHCGGCGLACAAGQLCQSISAAMCTSVEPPDTSGRCSCGPSAPCPMGQTCGPSMFCVPVLPNHCAPNQEIQQVSGCQTFCRYP